MAPFLNYSTTFLGRDEIYHNITSTAGNGFKLSEDVISREEEGRPEISIVLAIVIVVKIVIFLALYFGRKQSQFHKEINALAKNLTHFIAISSDDEIDAPLVKHGNPLPNVSQYVNFKRPPCASVRRMSI